MQIAKEQFQMRHIQKPHKQLRKAHRNTPNSPLPFPSNNSAQIQIPDVDTYKFPCVCVCKFRICANIHVFTVLTSNVLLSKRKASVRVPLSTFPPPPSPRHPTGASAARQRLTSTTLFSFAIVDIVISPSPSSSTSTSPLPLPAHSQYVFIQFAKHFHKIFPQEKHCAHINVYMCVSQCVCVQVDMHESWARPRVRALAIGNYAKCARFA